MNALSKRQSAILEYLADYITRKGYPPTVRETGRAVGIRSTSAVNYQLSKLVDKGFIKREKRVSRGIRLVNRVG